MKYLLTTLLMIACDETGVRVKGYQGQHVRVEIDPPIAVTIPVLIPMPYPYRVTTVTAEKP